MEGDKVNLLNNLLKELAKGNFKFVVNYPNYGNLNVEVIAMDFQNIDWKPVKVKVLDNVQKTERKWVSNNQAFGYDCDDDGGRGGQMEYVISKVNEEWFMLDWFESIQ
jgi:hypothetical protein